MQPLVLFNSLGRKKEEFQPLDPANVRMYTCGPTVYSYAHIGNMRAFLFADLLQRTLRFVCRYPVTWVMNITDIDDKTIRGSAPGSPEWRPEMGEQTPDPLENLRRFTRFYEQAFKEDIATLGIELEHIAAFPRATEYIEPMQELVRRIYEREIAYISQGSVYFNVTRWNSIDKYGKLVTIDFEHFRKGVRIDADEYDRESVADFVLWKARKPGEPFWQFSLGGEQCDGRPGWHLECSTMEYVLLGLPFDIHTGGIDLKFPHHEDEIAQSKAGYGVEPTRYWCHNEHLLVEGEKMSKSLGNFYTLRDLLARGIDPMDIRYIMLAAHYRSKLNFTFEALKAARRARRRVQRVFDELAVVNPAEQVTIPAMQQLRDTVFSALLDDLNTPKALGALFTFLRQHPVAAMTPAERAEYKAVLLHFNQVFHLWNPEGESPAAVEIPEEIRQLAEQRWAARQQKDYATADALRERIQQAGFRVIDTPSGYHLEPIEE